MTSTMAESASPTTFRRRPSRQQAGLLIALSSAAAFGLSGSLAKSLLDLGWSPSALVAVRILGAFVVLSVASVFMLRRTRWPDRRQSTKIIAYGLVAVAGAQLCYFSAVQYLSVGVALLLEYLAPVLLIGYHWVRTRQRPTGAVFVGAALSLAGLVLVLDLTSDVRISAIGVLWGLGAAVCLTGYFILSDDSGPRVHPLLLITGGTGIGGAAVLVLGLIGLLPLAAHTGTATLAGQPMGWWVPMAGLILVTAAFAYLAGVIGVRRLGSSVASFVSLTEVIFAVTFAVILLGQHPSGTQLVGGVLVLAGIAVVQRRAARS